VTEPKPKIWIDLDNTPHVPFFEPIMEELQTRGFPVLVTARDAFQVCELADASGLRYHKAGRHHGRNRLAKGMGLFLRAVQLWPIVRKEQPALGLSHGSRAQIILCNLLGLPTLLMEDYEHAAYPPLMRPSWGLLPDVISGEAWCLKKERIRHYPGLKEDVYAWKLEPDPAILASLGIAEGDLVVTVRPPATEAHYHNPESERLLDRLMTRLGQTPRARTVLLPRNQRQADLLRSRWPGWFEDGKTVIPSKALNGLNLIWHSDLVVSGGGTMNREAAALGVPVYSIFRGPTGAVDRHLEETGRLVFIQTPDDVDRKIRLEKRIGKPLSPATSRTTLQHIVNTVEALVSHAA
jgi:hypothetical protein